MFSAGAPNRELSLHCTSTTSYLAIAPLLVFARAGLAQDVEGCRDSPLISRFPRSVISSCTDLPDDAVELRTAEDTQRIEGEIRKINYDPPQIPLRLSSSATSRRRSRPRASPRSSIPGMAISLTGKAERGLPSSNMGGDYYYLTIVTEKQLKQEMFADAAALSIGPKGSGYVVASGILFDTGKAEIKPDSAPALQEIVKLLNQDPALTLYVVRHTDTVGNLAPNVELSPQGAAAVVAALTGKYGMRREGRRTAASNWSNIRSAGICSPH